MASISLSSSEVALVLTVFLGAEGALET